MDLEGDFPYFSSVVGEVASTAPVTPLHQRRGRRRNKATSDDYKPPPSTFLNKVSEDEEEEEDEDFFSSKHPTRERKLSSILKPTQTSEIVSPRDADYYNIKNYYTEDEEEEDDEDEDKEKYQEEEDEDQYAAEEVDTFEALDLLPIKPPEKPAKRTHNGVFYTLLRFFSFAVKTLLVDAYILTLIFTLFARDFQHIFLEDLADDIIFDGVTCIAIVSTIFMIIHRAIGKEEGKFYRLSLEFFWDLGVVLSLIFDLSKIYLFVNEVDLIIAGWRDQPDSQYTQLPAYQLGSGRNGDWMAGNSQAHSEAHTQFLHSLNLSEAEDLCVKVHSNKNVLTLWYAMNIFQIIRIAIILRFYLFKEFYNRGFITLLWRQFNSIQILVRGRKALAFIMPKRRGGDKIDASSGKEEKTQGGLLAWEGRGGFSNPQHAGGFDGDDGRGGGSLALPPSRGGGSLPPSYPPPHLSSRNLEMASGGDLYPPQHQIPSQEGMMTSLTPIEDEVRAGGLVHRHNEQRRVSYNTPPPPPISSKPNPPLGGWGVYGDSRTMESLSFLRKTYEIDVEGRFLGKMKREKQNSRNSPQTSKDQEEKDAEDGGVDSVLKDIIVKNGLFHSLLFVTVCLLLVSMFSYLSYDLMKAEIEKISISHRETLQDPSNTQLSINYTTAWFNFFNKFQQGYLLDTKMIAPLELYWVRASIPLYHPYYVLYEHTHYFNCQQKATSCHSDAIHIDNNALNNLGTSLMVTEGVQFDTGGRASQTSYTGKRPYEMLKFSSISKVTCNPPPTTPPSSNSPTISIIIDMRNFVKTWALVSICLKLIFSVVLSVGHHHLYSTASNVISSPIKRLTEKMQKIKKNPLAALSIYNDSLRLLAHGRRGRTRSRGAPLSVGNAHSSRSSSLQLTQTGETSSFEVRKGFSAGSGGFFLRESATTYGKDSGAEDAMNEESFSDRYASRADLRANEAITHTSVSRRDAISIARRSLFPGSFILSSFKRGKNHTLPSKQSFFGKITSILWFWWLPGDAGTTKGTEKKQTASSSPRSNAHTHTNKKNPPHYQHILPFKRKKNARKTPWEIVVLDKTVMKLMRLLVVGFGEAGAQIIAKNISTSSQGQFNAVVQGIKVNAIFGFCDIRQFTNATEYLRENVMVFVNRVAKMVHDTVRDYSGTANKNIGDAFLVLWKFPATDYDFQEISASNSSPFTIRKQRNNRFLGRGGSFFKNEMLSNHLSSFGGSGHKNPGRGLVAPPPPSSSRGLSPSWGKGSEVGGWGESEDNEDDVSERSSHSVPPYGSDLRASYRSYSAEGRVDGGKNASLKLPFGVGGGRGSSTQQHSLASLASRRFASSAKGIENFLRNRGEWGEEEAGRGEAPSHDDIIGFKTVSKLADLSLIAFLKILAHTKNMKMIDVDSREGLDQPQRGGNVMANTREGYGKFAANSRLRMGFGLHVGWAIEGAIGSEHKVDASYLSPNVNIASRLEAATKQYGVDLLLSGDLYRILSPEVQRYCRQIDRVVVKGSGIPLDIYTVDVDPTLISSSGLSPEHTPKQRKSSATSTASHRLLSNMKIRGAGGLLPNYYSSPRASQALMHTSNSISNTHHHKARLRSPTLGAQSIMPQEGTGLVGNLRAQQPHLTEGGYRHVDAAKVGGLGATHTYTHTFPPGGGRRSDHEDEGEHGGSRGVFSNEGSRGVRPHILGFPSNQQEVYYYSTLGSTFDKDPDLLEMRSNVNEEFNDVFNRGYMHYEAGQWREAMQLFNSVAEELYIDDGPTNTLLQFMSEYDYVAPEGWKGYRKLMDK